MTAPVQAPVSVEMARELCAGCMQPLPVVDVEAGETTHANCETPPPQRRRSGPHSPARAAQTPKTSTATVVAHSLPEQRASFDLLRAAGHERRIWWGGFETGHRYGVVDGYADGHVDGRRVGWIERDRASLEDAAEQWAHMGAPVTGSPSEAELRRLRSPEAACAYRIAVRDPASRNDVHTRADLVRVCAESWGADW